MELEEKNTRKYGVSVPDTSSSASLLSMLRDPAHRSKLWRWVWLPCSLFSLGLVGAQRGPTLLDLEIITGQDKTMGSLYLTSMSGGVLLGSFVSGAIHGKLDNNLVMATACAMGGALTIASPYCSHFVAMLCIRGITGFFLGAIDCIANAEHMHIWGIEGEGLLQFVHFTYAIGGVVSPAFSAPFLAEKENKTKASEMVLNVTLSPTINDTGESSTALHPTTNVHYAYLISGTILTLTAVPFLVMLLFCKQSTPVATKHAKECAQRNMPTSLRVFLIAVVCVYYMAYVCIENTFNSFLETFVVTQYEEVSEAQGSYINTFYWTAFAAGRFSAIFVSEWLIAVRLMYVQFCIMTVAFSGFLVSALYGQLDALKAFTCLIGVALSSMYPSGISWIEAEIMTVTGRITGVILVGSSIGATANPYIMGFLMEQRSNFWFCYFLMGSVLLTILVFLFLLSFNRLYVNSRYGMFGQSQNQGKQTDLPTQHEHTKPEHTKHVQTRHQHTMQAETKH
ncbi:hypothetical protein BsWGS_00110 [Bradybaena similaris]